MKRIIYIILLLSVIACKKDEIPVLKHQAGNVISNAFEMGTDYRKQAFFDLETNAFVSENIKTSWDLGFETGVNGSSVILNSANFMSIAKVNNTTFNAVTDTVGLDWLFDVPSGNLDSTAIGDWQNTNSIYVVNRGNDHLGAHRGFCKIEFQSVSGTTYTFRIANLNGTSDEMITITKDDALNYVAFSCDTRAEVEVEPNKEAWDIQFTQYTYVFVDLHEEYLVTGVLANRNGVQTAKVFDKEFADITSEDIGNYNFSDAIDVIGYDWKYYDFSLANYTVHLDQNYLIKTTEGIFYKLHFIDFYNENGDKGTPTFEIQKL
ncbi:MAG: hypothetical protein N4A35_14980 [Flavobacteriales bacterium]|jgi:hypothetical protein|nr:hypothetical protein [Flavobacteriales bacterium]